ncbi:MAG: protease SohB [Bdellovibrionota bacterium]
MEFALDLVSFIMKTLIIVAAIGVVVLIFIQAGTRGRRARAGLDVDLLNDRYKDFRRNMQGALLGKKEFKAILKSEKKEDKAKDKNEDDDKRPRVFVMDFDGDIRASQVTNLREEITAVLTIAKPGDEAIVRLESGGGLVTSYGLAASQLARLKTRGVRLTVCIDKVAASGGYMMACVADHIIAAPFAVLGSIGVIAQVPNFHKVLKKHDVDYKEVTAGEFKRTVTVFGEITEPGMRKFKDQIEETHELFKAFVKYNRPALDISRVATGEYWYGTQALALGLADQLSTSDDYLYTKAESANLYQVQYQSKKKLAERLSESFSLGMHSLFTRIWGDLDRTRFGA